jgi:hypothetical protein
VDEQAISLGGKSGPKQGLSVLLKLGLDPSGRVWYSERAFL